MNILIMRAFVSMRKFLINNAQIFQRLDRIETKQLIYDKNFDKLFKLFETNQPTQKIFFDGQLFDAYKSVSDLIKSHDRFLIIDNKEVYHIGTSLKDLGKKWFAFSKIKKESLNIIEKLEQG